MSEDTHTYKVSVEWIKDTEGNMTIGDKPKQVIASPPEFDGPGGIITPEEMFVASSAGCFMTTFVHFTKKMRFEHKSFRVEGEGTLERAEKGFHFTKIVLKAAVVVESEDLVSKAERALELTGKYCLISNSMKCETIHENQVIVE
ncbi:OsmC family peroxiredoxin [Candidatus Thorarchaeota archaeon]|nr:MAG: OsmC family peroxiredoxin [Candidatus Thorarchaeota archaeon]